ncbi:MAG: uracil-DNA glycosylase [Spirochaetales bacterium]
MENKEKRRALESALERTDELFDAFSDVLRRDFSGKGHPKRDFSATVQKLVPEPKIEEPAFENAPQDREDERLHMSLEALISDSKKCSRCGLCSTRTNVVFGTGCTDRPTVMVIGEGPGETEDLQGLPFVGRAGLFLDKWLSAISLSRDRNVYITNTVKCRPPQNRDPLPDEKKACFAYLKQQISIIHPQAILCLGRPASTLMTGQPDSSMGALRGRFFFFDGIPMICTYHPAAVLRDMELKRPVWDDLKKLARYLGLPVGGK